MSQLFPRASLKRSPRIRTRKNSISYPSEDARCPLSRSSTTSRPKMRPPPLQIIPELSEDELDVSTPQSPSTARPISHLSRFTLSAYTFSIDDALLMFSDEPPCSPALSASSSTTGSEYTPSTPGDSDNEEYDLRLPTPRIRPQHLSIRPLCITKTRSLLCQDDEDVLPKDEEKVAPLLVVLEQPQYQSNATEEAEQDFYAREFQDFISLYTGVPNPSSPARRDSVTLDTGSLPSFLELHEPKPKGRSRHSKPLPSLPPVTPPPSTFPFVPTFTLVQTTAQKSIVRRKRNIRPCPTYPPPLPPAEPRPLPRMAVPEDVDILGPSEAMLEPPRNSIVIEQVYDEAEDASVYSQASFTALSRRNTCLLPPAIPETPLASMYGDFCLPILSTIDSGTPRSSLESTSSVASSYSNSLQVPISPFSFPGTPRSPSSDDHESIHPLRSRWSASTLASIAAEQPHSTLLSPLRTVFGSRTRRAPAVPRASPSRSVPSRNPLNLHLLTPSKLPAQKSAFPMTPSPPGTPARHIRRRSSRSSTSSSGTNRSSMEFDSGDSSPGGLRRKPIPVEMFIRV